MKNQYFRLQDVGVFTLYGWESLANIRRWQCHQKERTELSCFLFDVSRLFYYFLSRHVSSSVST